MPSSPGFPWRIWWTPGGQSWGTCTVHPCSSWWQVPSVPRISVSESSVPGIVLASPLWALGAVQPVASLRNAEWSPGTKNGLVLNSGCGSVVWMVCCSWSMGVPSKVWNSKSPDALHQVKPGTGGQTWTCDVGYVLFPGAQYWPLETPLWTSLHHLHRRHWGVCDWGTHLHGGGQHQRWL